MVRMQDAGRLKRGMFHYFMAVAERCGEKILERRARAFRDRLLYGLGRALVYAPVKNGSAFRG